MLFKNSYGKLGYILLYNLLKLYFYSDYQVEVINNIYKPLCKLCRKSRISAGPDKITSYMLESNESDISVIMNLMGKLAFHDKPLKNIFNKNMNVVSLYLERELRSWVRKCFLS